MLDVTHLYKQKQEQNKKLRLRLVISSSRGLREYTDANELQGTTLSGEEATYNGSAEYDYDPVLLYDAGVVAGNTIIDYRPIVLSWGSLVEGFGTSTNLLQSYTRKPLRNYVVVMANENLYWSQLLDRERILSQSAKLIGSYRGLDPSHDIVLMDMKIVRIVLLAKTCTLTMVER